MSNTDRDEIGQMILAIIACIGIISSLWWGWRLERKRCQIDHRKITEITAQSTFWGTQFIYTLEDGTLINRPSGRRIGDTLCN